MRVIASVSASAWGFGPAVPGATIWIHAVSVGEVQAAHPLDRAAPEASPAYGILLTTVTPTGAARARLLFGDHVHLRYVPLDLPGSVSASSTACSRSSR